MASSSSSWLFVSVRWRWRLAVAVFLFSLCQQGPSRASNLTSAVGFHKCYCDKFQAWDGAQCSNHTTVIPVYQQNFDASKGDVINLKNNLAVSPTANFKNVDVGDVECSEGLFRTVLSDFALLPDGRLLSLRTNNTFPPWSFCIVNVLDNEQFYHDAHICLPPPAVSHCCPKNHLMGQDGSCYQQDDHKAPPIQIGQHEVDWATVDGPIDPPSCGEHEYHHYVPLREGEGQLGKTHPMATFGWIPPFWIAEHSWVKNYCVALKENEEGDFQYVAQICLKDYAEYNKKQCGDAACVRKCCHGDDLLYHRMCAGALHEDEVWKPSQLPNQTINELWTIVTGEPGCSSHLHQGSMNLLPNGDLQLAPDLPPVPSSGYCLENNLDDFNNIQSVAIVCLKGDNLECLWRDILIKVVLAVSCVFLVLTLAVYLGVAELRDQMYGRCLISMVVAMLTAYICFIINPEEFSDASCYAKAFMFHLSSLAMFFWLNVMCFDMWKILRGSLRQTHSMKVFLCYCAYAWGCPLVISIITIALDVKLAQDVDMPSHSQGLILPQFIDGLCWFNSNEAYWLYFSGFILLLVVVNIGFFIHVAITLYRKMKKGSKTLESASSQVNKTTKSKKKVWLFVKLFLVMGVLWITDALSALSHRKTCTYWVVTDVINSLQGVFIFIVAVCNKDNMKKMKDAWAPRLKVVRKTLPNLTARRPTQTNDTTTDDTEYSRKTSITSLPRKISQVSNILFGSSKSLSTLSPPTDSSYVPAEGGRKGSNVSLKDIIPLATMHEESRDGSGEQDKTP